MKHGFCILYYRKFHLDTNILI